MTILDNLSDENLLEISALNIEEEIKKRGYKYGWYKPVSYVGEIYILVNPSFQNLVKIGYADDVEKRLKQLNRNSGLPDPFHCYAMYSVKKRLEDLKLHKLIDSLDSSLRHSNNREFYEMSKEKAYSILQAIAEINGDEERLVFNPFNDAYFNKIEEKESGNKNVNIANKIVNKPIKSISRAQPLTFEMINIPIGSELLFEDGKTKVITVDLVNKVKLGDDVCSISRMVAHINKTDRAYQGGMFFFYKGKRLTDIRKELDV